MTYNQIPYNYTVEVTNRFKGFDLINRETPKDSHQKERATWLRNISNTLHRLWKDIFHRQLFIDEWRKEGTEMDRDRGFRHRLQIFVMCHKGKLPFTGSPCIFTCPGFWLFPKHVLCMCVAQTGPTLCDPLGCNPPNSPIYGIRRAGILESIAIS